MKSTLFLLLALAGGAVAAGTGGSDHNHHPVTRAADTAWGAAPAPSDQDREEPLPIRTGWGPSADEIERAREMVADMSLKQRAGQVIVARYSGTAAPAKLVNGLHLGGVVVFSDNISSAAQIKKANRVLQRSANAAGRPAADADADAGIGDTGDGGDTRDGSDTGDVGTADGLAGRLAAGPVDDVRIGDATACPEPGGRATADWAGAEAGDSPRATRSTRLRRPPPRSTSLGHTPSSTT